MTLTAGIIGCGEITSGVRADQLHNAPNVEIGMTMDVEEWAAKDIAERYNASHTTDEEDVFSNPEIDFVYIATPNHLHASQTIDAARAGKHVAVEKPMATTAGDAREMIKVCKQEDIHLSVPLGRFTPGAAQVKEWITDGLIGDLVGTRIASLGRKPQSYWQGGYSGRIESEWRKRADEAGGGILLMNNIHDIDRLRYITGLEAERVYAEGDTFTTDIEVEDLICVTIRFANGAIGNIESSSFAQAGFEGGPFNRIYGKTGTIVLSNPLRVWTAHETKLGKAETWHEVPAEPMDLNFFEEFVSAVEESTQVPVPPEDARKDLEVVLAAYKSAETNEPIELPLNSC